MTARFTKSGSLEVLKEKGLAVGTVIDIGVHRHTPELINAFPDKPHLLFEPVTEYYEDIKKNYAAINFTLFPVALSSESSEGFLRTFDVTGLGGVSHSSISTAGGEGTRHIQIAALDDVLKSRNDATPYLIKLDVDGAEMQILKGAAAALQKTDCVIIECPISIDANMFFDRANFLREQGFVLWDIVDFCYYKNQLSQVDLVFIKHQVKQTKLSPWHDGPFDPAQWNAMYQ